MSYHQDWIAKITSHTTIPKQLQQVEKSKQETLFSHRIGKSTLLILGCHNSTFMGANLTPCGGAK